MLKKVLLALVAVASLSGCGAYDKWTKKEKGRKGDEVKPELAGRWVSACTPKGPFGLIELIGEKHELNFAKTPGDVTKTTLRFSDKDCKKPLYKLDTKSTYAVVGNASEPGTKNINFTVHKALITPSDAEAAATLNKEKLCDITDWAAGVEKNVIGKTCDHKKFTEGQVVFDIYKHEGKNIFLGKSSFFLDGSSAGDRPKAIDKEHPLVKQ